MRKLLSIALVAAVSFGGVPLSALPAAYDSVAVSGNAYTPTRQPLSNAVVQIRNVKTGALVNSTVTGAAGEFAFKDVPPGMYIVEIVNSSGAVQGMSAPITLGSAPLVNVYVSAASQGMPSSERAGFRLFGLGPVATLAVLGAAGAAGVTAVVSTRPDASPSR
jgi:hypothetical protein